MLARLTLFLVLALAAHARALTCPAPASAPRLEAIDPELRLRFVAAQLEREVNRMHAWSWSWGTTYAVATVTQATVLPFVADRGVRVDLGVGAVSAGIGSLALFLLPLRITLPAEHALAETSDSDRCRVLAQLEEALAGGALVERLTKSWISHAGNVALNVAIMLVLGLGYGRWQSAGISAGVGIAVGEANLLTQPAFLPSVHAAYLRGDLGFPMPPDAPHWTPSMAAAGPAVSLGWSF